MEYRPLELTVISATDIKDFKLIGKMDAFVVVTLGGDLKTKQKTTIDRDGGTNPNWNYQMKFNIDEVAAQKGGLALVFKLFREHTLGGEKEIGYVHVPVKELLESAGKENAAQFVYYQVRKPSGKAKGQLNFLYKFGEKISAPMPAAHPPPVAGYGGYAPAAPPGGYPYPPPQPAYGYPPQQGYPKQPVQQPQKKKNNFGLGLGVGLRFVGDLIGDAIGFGGSGAEE